MDSEFPRELIDNVRLSLVSGVGPRARQQLLARFGSIEAILSAHASDLQSVDGIGPTLARRITAATEELDAEAELRLAKQNGIDVLIESGEDYPTLLREIHDPPGVLFRQGSASVQDELAIAIVGTRHATRYGLQQAERFAGGLARAGFTVVSGLARGIDGAVHRGALAAGGRTIAVLAGGLLSIYPPEHHALAQEIRSSGYLVSEAPPRMKPSSGSFPQRNRIISGLCVGTLVIEAPLRSGALITIRHAYEQGREAFAMPGPIDSRMSGGCHAVIKDGAKLVESIDDVLEELGPLVRDIPQKDGTTLHQPAELTLNPIEKKVLDAIESQPTSVDGIMETCELPVHRVLSTISVLEMRRLIERVSGTQVVRK